MDDDLKKQLEDVSWVGTPMKHQERGVALLLAKNEMALFWEPGAGKTYAVVHAAKTRFNRGEIDVVVIIAPNSVRQVWPREFALWAPETPVKCNVMSAGDELKRPSEPCLEVLVVAIEALSQGHAYSKIMAHIKGRKVMVVNDESSRIKNPSSNRTKNATNIAWSAWYRAILTGTPVLQGPHDLFAQMRFLNPDIIGIKKWAAFRAKYCVMGGFQNRQIVKHINVDDLVEKMSPYIDMVRIEECLDLPSKIYQKIDVPLSKEQKEAISMLKHENILDIADMDIFLAVEMALEKMTRIQQIVGGSLPYRDEETGKYDTKPLQGTIPKLEALMDYIEDVPHHDKCLIWARFRPERDRIIERLSEVYGHYSVVRLDGAVKGEELRKIAVDRLQNDPKCRFFVSAQQTGGIGLTLTRAKYSLYYSNTFSAEDRVQTENRNYRKGQTEHTVHVDFEAQVKEDRIITKALKLKGSLAEYVKEAISQTKNRGSSGAWDAIMASIEN